MGPKDYADGVLLDLVKAATKVETTKTAPSEINKPRDRLAYLLRQRFAAGVDLPPSFEASLSAEELKTAHRALSFITDYRVELATGGNPRVWKLFAFSLRVETLHSLNYAPFLTGEAHDKIMTFMKDAGEETNNITLAMQAVPFANLESMSRLERTRLLDDVVQNRLAKSLRTISPPLPMRKSAPFMILGAVHTSVIQTTEPRKNLRVQRFQLTARNGLPVANASISGPPARFSKVLRNAGINYVCAFVADAVRAGNSQNLSIRIPALWLENDQPRRVQADIEGPGMNESLNFNVEPYDVPAMRAHTRKIANDMRVRLVEPN